MNGELTAPKSTVLKQYTTSSLLHGICWITEPEEVGVVSITLMKMNMEKGFLYISGNSIVVYAKAEDD